MTPALALAIDVGGTSLKGELVDADGSVVAARTATTPRGAAARDAIAALGETLLAEAVGRAVVGAGVTVPGAVDRAAGVATYSSNIGWRDLELVEALGHVWSLPVRIGNDVVSGGIAEHRTGAGRDTADLVFVPIGTGIAAALVSRGRLVSGDGGTTAELGHVVVRPGATCGCGQDGCVEAWASAGAISRRYAELAGRPVPGAEAVADRLDDDDVARRVWADAVDALADGLTTLALLFGPAPVAVGGGLARAGERLLAPLRAALEQRARVFHAPPLRTAVHGSRAGVVGAGMLARDGWKAET
jgi:glucokinase